MLRETGIALISAFFVALIATGGDYVWASRLLSHRMAYGLVHGAGLCLALGLALGLPARRPLSGAIGGLVVGVMAASFYYVLAPAMGYAAMFAAWVVLWMMLAYLEGPVLRGGSRPGAIVRGVVAALASGLAFYAVSGMWTRWNPESISYTDHLWRWTVAFLPGFLALRLPMK